MKIPVKEILITGDWVQCESKDFFCGESIFRFRTTSFEKINCSLIDSPEELKLDQGILWSLKIEVVSLSKTPIGAYMVSHIMLMDQDDFRFAAVKDDHLTCNSEYSKLTGLDRFNGWSSTPQLSPKIKTVGALAYLLPDDDQADYFFSISAGSMRAL